MHSQVWENVEFFQVLSPPLNNDQNGTVTVKNDPYFILNAAGLSSLENSIHIILIHFLLYIPQKVKYCEC